jgi:drug/metabolite transporter (DMT)-like permease
MTRFAGLRASPYLLLALTAFSWSLNWVIGRAIVGHVSPLVLTWMRWFIALATMLPFAWGEIRAHRATIRRHWKTIAWLGFWGTGLHNAFAYVGLQYTTATNGVILNSSVPVMIIVLAWIVYRDTITRVQAAGVAISLGGIVAIITRGDLAALAELSLNKGDLIVVAGMTFWAAYTVFLRGKPPGLPPLALLACCGCVGLTLLTPLAIAEVAFFGGHAELTLPAIAAMLYIGIFPSFVGYVFWNRGVAEVGPQVAGVFMHLMPAFGVVLAWLFLGERLHSFHWIGIALILAGIALATRGERAGVPEPIPE